MNKVNYHKAKRTWKLPSIFVCSVLTTISMSTSAELSEVRPGSSPEYPISLPGIGDLRTYIDPTCAKNMVRSTVEVFNDEYGAMPWYSYTCTFKNNGWCSLSSDNCPEQVCHDYTEWVGPWNNQYDPDPVRSSFYTCVSIGTPYPF